MQKNIDCTVVGDSFVDIILPLNGSEDMKYFFHGGAISTKAKISPGGLANVAVNIAKLGGISAFVGKVGKDHFGEIVKDDLIKHGVKSHLSISRNHSTGIAFILVQPNKERFIIVDRGANNYLEKKDVEIELCLSSKYLYISAYSFQSQKTCCTVKKVVKEVADNVNIVFNPAAPNIIDEYHKQINDFIKNYVDVLVLNEVESARLVPEQDLFEEMLSYVDIIALTKGEKGSVVATPNMFLNIKPFPINVVDTTGAGDSYSAGLIYGLSRDWSLDKAANLASKIAGMTVSAKGARQ